jgi:hypothetical protein
MDRPSDEEIRRVLAWQAAEKAERDRLSVERYAEQQRERKAIQAENSERIAAYFEGKRIEEIGFQADDSRRSDEIDDLAVTFEDGSWVDFDIEWEGSTIDLTFHPAPDDEMRKD